MKKYVVAEGYSFTANGHIYSAGEEISENVFADKVYFGKLTAEKKILSVEDKKEISSQKNAEEEFDIEEKPVSKKSSKSTKAE